MEIKSYCTEIHSKYSGNQVSTSLKLTLELHAMFRHVKHLLKNRIKNSKYIFIQMCYKTYIFLLTETSFLILLVKKTVLQLFFRGFFILF